MIEKKINVEARGMKIWNYISERALAEQLQDEIDNKKTINENINSKLIAYVKLLKEQGMTKEDIRNRLDEIMLVHYKGVDMTAWNKPLNAMVNKYTTKENCEFRELNEINITRKELEFINRFQDEAKENLLFTMLVVSKSKHCKFKKNKKGEILSENHDYWLNCDRVQLFKLANFKYDKNTGAKTRMEQRGYFIYDLAQLDGTIELSKQCDNTSIKLLYVDEEVDPEGITFRITENNMNDVLNYYLQWKNPDEEHETFNNLVWNGWKYLSRPFEVIVSDMTSFRVKGTYYELTMYFDAWNKEIPGYGLSSKKGDRRTYRKG